MASTPPARSHHRLSFARDPPRLRAYANLYRYGEPGGPAPLVVYVGGAIKRTEYVARYDTEPLPILTEFEKALTLEGLARVDLLVCPCPVDTGGAGLEGFVEHYDAELLPALGAEPAALGCVGYSAGAAYAVHLAIVAEARAVAVLGATGVREAAVKNRALVEKAAKEGAVVPALALFRNDGDQTADPRALGRSVPAALRAQAMPLRPGLHRYRDYASNGAVAAAFRFVLDRLDR
jgi:hypothetical protein